MAITLNLQHTFTTRVVYSTEQVAELRAELESNVKTGKEYITHIKDPKKKATAKAGLKLLDMALSMDDEGLVLFLTREAFKNGLREDLIRETKELNVTRLGPVQTTMLADCSKCIHNETCIKVARAGCTPVEPQVVA